MPLLPFLALQSALAPVPVVVELFTSEGCSSCPSADDLLARYAARADAEGARVILLSEHVDYWNRLGWQDRFSSPAFSARQTAYGTRFKLNGVYTPQAIVDGEQEFVGSDEPALLRSLRTAAKRLHLAVRIEPGSDGQLRIMAPKAAGADVIIATVLPPASTQVGRGENAGRTLRHVGVVSELRRLGPANGTVYEIAKRENATVAFVQTSGYGRILGSAVH